MAKTAKVSSKKRKVVVEPVGEAHVCASFNNLIVTLTNKAGQVISWSSAGKMAIRTIHTSGIEVTEIIDVTPLPHNGCRPPKRRRV